VYRSTKAFPADERFALTSQIRRAAVGVASNIAEGYGRGGRSDYIRFLKIARGSLYELDTQLQLACDLTYLDQSSHAGLKSALNESERILAGLIRSLEAPEPIE
jgi:four helix bundle protein